MTKRKHYHHGNLREALLKAAIRLIGEVGPTAFTLREVARRAGVSHNAPYRHFRDKEEVIAAVRTQGFIELKEAMLRSVKGYSHPLDQLKQSGLAYIQFALRRPEHFTAMFDAPITKRKHPASAQASEEAFETLVDFIRKCQQADQLPSGDPYPYALLAWSQVHGIAKLAIARRFRFRSKAQILHFAKFAMNEGFPGSTMQDAQEQYPE